MRTAPALQVTVARFDRWRAALLGLALVAVTAPLAWWWTAAVPAAAGAGLFLGTVLLAAAVLRAEWRRRPALLHWDGQCWYWRGIDEREDCRHPGRVDVALDLGRWMLLRLLPEGAGWPGSRTVWLPVQAAGLERSWHALRCAVYSPTPAAAPLAAMNSPTHER